MAVALSKGDAAGGSPMGTGPWVAPGGSGNLRDRRPFQRRPDLRRGGKLNERPPPAIQGDRRRCPVFNRLFIYYTATTRRPRTGSRGRDSPARDVARPWAEVQRGGGPRRSSLL